MSNDALDKITKLVEDAAQQASDTGTKIMVSYDDTTMFYDEDGDLSENRDIHIKIMVEPLVESM